jgi:hypothetical protein
MDLEPWQLEPLNWSLDVFDFGELETLDYEPLETFSALRSELGSLTEIKAGTLPK